MVVLKCKMCGGTLKVQEGTTVCECEYCGSKQTIPTVDDEGLQTLYNRANMLRMRSEFDKASELYEKILQKKDTEAEAYWGLILCKYGIEYVEDPKTYMRVPTCHRTSYEAVTADEDYKNALKYAELGQRVIYEDEARKIDEIQRGILAIAQKEDPYDVFICYKETDDSGKRTPDSVIANDIYHQLTQEGFKVFYAAITLEDKLGTEYEPYIFSALNTSKVMLAIGTKPEYFNAVWVKNEWSRFLKNMKKDRSKLLIPCYRDMDPYELPEEFAHLQAQDMSKIGFINDIVRGIKKVIVKETSKPVAQEVTVQQGAGSTTASAQIKRGNMALEDHDWDKADSFFEEALNLAPECAEAFIGKLLARDKKPGFASWLTAQEGKYNSADTMQLEACPEDTAHIENKVQELIIEGYLKAETIRDQYKFDRRYASALSCRKSQKANQLRELGTDRLLSRAKKYAKGGTKQQIEEGLEKVIRVLDERIAKAQEEDEVSIARIKKKYAEHIENADQIVEKLNADAQKQRDREYESAVSLKESAVDLSGYEKARDALRGMNGYRDSNDLVAECQEEINRLTEQKQQEEARVAEAKAKKRRKTIGIISAAVVACVILVVVVIIPNNSYNNAIALMENGDYESALTEFEKLGRYKDSSVKAEEAQEKIIETEYQDILTALDNQQYDGLSDRVEKLGDYKDCAVILEELKEYNSALEALNTRDSFYIGEDAFSQAKYLIANGKYVHFSENAATFINVVGGLVGNWTYSNGDDKILSYRSPDSSDHKSDTEIEIKYQGTLDGLANNEFPLIQVFEKGSEHGMFAGLPQVDFESETATENNYTGGDFVFSFKDGNTLVIDFYGNAGMPEHVTTEYVRAN